MKPYFTSAISGLLITLLCSAQDAGSVKSNALSIELGKNGVIYNLSYDHKFKGNKLGLHILAGSNFAHYLNAKSAGGGVYCLFGNGNHYFESGIDIQYLVVDEGSNDQRGFSFLKPDYSIRTYYLSLNCGYRYYGKNILFRIGISPGIINDDFIPGAYISLGLLF